MSGVSIGLLLTRFVAYREFTFGYMVWNLLLAALPLVASVWLARRLATESWLTKENLVLTALWLGFLPNSFYVITDLIHIAEVSSNQILFDSVMLFSFAVTGLALGYASVILIHKALRQRLQHASTNRLVTVIFLACGYAIYLGRYMRWNTWDVLINPIGLLSNVADSIVNPSESSPAVQTTLLFFIFISVGYLTVLQLFPGALRTTSGKQRSKRVK